MSKEPVDAGNALSTVSTVPQGPVLEGGAVTPVEFEAADALPRALKVIATVAAPTTVLTSLMFYFGLLYAVGYFRYFGVNYTVLELPAQDYLVLSADGAIIPLAILASTTLFALWIYQLPLQNLCGKPRDAMRWIFMPVVTIMGVVLVACAAADAIGVGIFPENFWEARGISLTVGVLMVAYGSRLRHFLRPQDPAVRDRRVPDAGVVGKWAAVSVLVSIGLFWAMGSYGIGVGSEAAKELAINLQCQPSVILYSEKSLNLNVAGVTEEKPRADEGGHGFRYDGLRLVPQSGSRYLLLPSGWVRTRSPAILVSRSDISRMEFVLASGTPSAPC